jgi:hypothetical protein
MRRFHKEKTFKGSVFATFADRETAEKFVKDEASSTYKEKPLVKMLQDDYWQSKVKVTKEKRQVEKQAKLAKKLEQIAEQEKLAMQVSTEYPKNISNFCDLFRQSTRRALSWKSVVWIRRTPSMKN